jgi:hypothetical protein
MAERRPPNATNRETHQSLERIRRRQERRLADLARGALKSPEARAFLGTWLDGRTGLFRTSFNPSGSVMCFQEGQRNAGIELLAFLERADPAMTDQMIAEVRARKRADDAEIDAVQTPSAEQARDEEDRNDG